MMFDAIKGLSRDSRARRQYEELEALVNSAREERSALAGLLTELTALVTRLADAGKSLETVDEKAVAAAAHLDALGKRIERLEQDATALNDVEAHAQALIASATAAQRETADLLAPDGELQQHRRHTQQLASQVSDAQASIETLAGQLRALEHLHSQLRQSSAELSGIRESVDQAGLLRSELGQLRATMSQMTEEIGAIGEAAREADDSAFAAAETVKDMQRRLARVEELRDMSDSIEEKLASVNALAEHVNQKTRTFEAQRHVIDRAVAETQRVDDIVWNMNSQIAKIGEWLQQAERNEERLRRIDQLVSETGIRLDAATTMRDDFMRETSRLEQDGQALVHAMERHVERLADGHRGYEAFEQRVRAAEGVLRDLEERIDSLRTRDQQLAALPARIDELTGQVRALDARADELAGKQAALEPLEAQLACVQQLSARVAAEAADLHRSQADLAQLREEIQQLYQAYAGAERLRDGLAADRVMLEAFGERVASFCARVPELEAMMDALLAKSDRIDEGMRLAGRLNEVTVELHEEITRVGQRAAIVDVVERRLNLLDAVASDVDRRLDEQTGRQAELNALAGRCDELAAQVIDIQRQFEATATLRGALLPLQTEVSRLQDRLQDTRDRVDGVQRQEVRFAEQETRFLELADAGRALADNAAERMTTMQSLVEQLVQSVSAVERASQSPADGVDLQAITDLRTEVVALTEQLQDLLAVAAATESRLAMDGVQTRAAHVADLLDTVRVSLEAVGERRAMVDRLAGRLVTVQSVMQEAQKTLQLLSQERKLAERIELNFRELRLGTGRPPRDGQHA